MSCIAVEDITTGCLY